MKATRVVWCSVLVVASLLALSIPVSFYVWFNWTHPQGRCFLHYEHGVLNGNKSLASGPIPAGLPWYGQFHVSRISVYEPWVRWPSIRRMPGGVWAFRLPMHVVLYLLLPVVAYPGVLFVLKRHRPRRGWRILTTRGFVYGTLVGITLPYWKVVCGPPLAAVFDVLQTPGWLLSLLITGRPYHSMLAIIGTTVFYAAMGVSVHALLRPRSHSPGYCVNCDYNLTGNVTGICPECGTEVKSP